MAQERRREQALQAKEEVGAARKVEGADLAPLEGRAEPAAPAQAPAQVGAEETSHLPPVQQVERLARAPRTPNQAALRCV